MNKSYLQYISYYLPEQTLTNEDLSQIFPEWSAEKILKKTGVQTRHVTALQETAVDMAEKAANCLFEEYSLDRSGIDFLLLCTQSPDYYLPTSACILQDRLDLKETCGAFDYNLGCSGFVYGLGVAKGLIESGQAENVLLLTSETYTKYLHPEDKSCRTIFGDGAAATLVSSKRCDDGLNAQICNLTYRTIGSHFQSLIVENGCSRHSVKGKGEDSRGVDNNYIKSPDYLFMDGRDIFEFSARAVPDVMKENLSKNNLSIDDISLFVLHQANAYMLNYVKMRTKIPTEKFVVDLAEQGNTVSSTIPIAFVRRIKNEPLPNGSNILMCGFGVGLSVGSVVLKI